MTRPVIVWFRQDLRLSDHPALQAAVATGRPVVPVFILEPAAGQAWAPGGATRWWLHHSLHALGESLAHCGARLVLRRGAAVAVLAALVAETGAETVFTGAMAEPEARATDRAVAAALAPVGAAALAPMGAAALAPTGATLRRLRTAFLFSPKDIQTGAGRPYAVYTPFSNACLIRSPAASIPPPSRLPAASVPVASDRLEDWGLLPTRPDWAAGLRRTWTPGEAGARDRLSAFLARPAADYARLRDRPDTPATSMLSPHLHFGEISADAVWRGVLEQGGDHQKFVKELLWREFSIHQLWHNPALPDAPARPAFEAMAWRDDPAGLTAWQRGETGVPIVDAGMRELWQTGWMHNRVRMVVASFLVKHLLIDWRHGERWFWDTLVDADLAANAANWQWVAGSGADAAPYFRVFNPVLQGRKFDPEGAYVRRYVPALRKLDARFIHAPWEAPAAVLAAAGIVLGRTYPRAVVDLGLGRERALAAFAALRAGA